uniref:Uncharacterized protein n=1 Tax=Anguilla anguilla TaxID=7936 RepID=A0A0E9RWP3_ANGAN
MFKLSVWERASMLRAMLCRPPTIAGERVSLVVYRTVIPGVCWHRPGEADR